MVKWAWHFLIFSLCVWVCVASHYHIIMRLGGRVTQCPCDSQVQIVDGAQGQSLWEAEFVCPRLAVEDSSVLTASGQSVFLFWAGDPLAQPQNASKATPLCRSHDQCTTSERRLIGCVCVPQAAEPVLRKLFLLHPNYPTILLELSSTTDTILSAAGEPHPHWPIRACLSIT